MSRKNNSLTNEREQTDVMVVNWWMLALRGVAAVVFGVLAFIWPGLTLLSLVFLFGAYAIVNGIFALIGVFKSPKGAANKISLGFIGLLSIVAGFLTFLIPGITALGLVLLIAAWAMVNGITEIVAAIRLRKTITNEWLLILAGILSIGFSILLVLQPGIGALALIFWIGAWAIAMGILLMILAFKLRSRHTFIAVGHAHA
jgi:uncharacterized membrane protein HdeD (DUF308 family)